MARMENASPKVKRSWAFKNASSRAEGYARSPEKLAGLIGAATRKAHKHKRGPLREVWQSLMDCLRLLKVYASGEYRQIPWRSLLLIIASVIYFVMPVDSIPDFIIALGFVDDAALLVWTMSAVKTDLADFVAWEKAEQRVTLARLAENQPAHE